MTPSGKVSTIYSFCSEPNCSDGEYPNPTPVLGSDGNLYGTAPAGANGPGTGFGTFFKMTLGGKLTTLYSFCPSSPCDDGVSPNGVVLASDGNFYGTTPVAGKSDAGTIFQISPTGQFKLLYTFCSECEMRRWRKSRLPANPGPRRKLLWHNLYWGNERGRCRLRAHSFGDLHRTPQLLCSE